MKFTSQTSLVVFFINFPNLHYIQVSRNDKVAGNLKGTALSILRDKPDPGNKLIKLRLTDRVQFDKAFSPAVQGLSVARKKLAIEISNTHERHGNVNTWLSRKGKYGYQAFDGHGGFDQCGSFCGF